MVDLAVLLIIVLFALLGLTSGLLMQVLRLVAAVVGVVVALEFSGVAMEAWPSLLSGQPGFREMLFPAVLFMVVYLLLTLLARLVVGLLRTASTTLSAADRLLGGVAGLIKGAVLCYFLIVVLLSAEIATKSKVQGLDLDGSLAVDFVRGHPMGRISDEMGRLKEWTGDVVDDVREGTGELIDEAREAVE
ncbi:MAG: CvpA family protein [Deltaproteobacteria bacterium]|nr:CvpA family protein [Deltaproteobacteria bacterium]